MPTGLTRSPSQLIRRGVQARLADVHTWLPGAVMAYDGTSNLADVEVLVQHPVFDDDGKIIDYEDLGVLAGVPVGFYRAGGMYVAGPVAKGDEGILLFSSSAIGEWRATGQKSKPADPARCSLGYPYFLPFAFNDTRTLPDATARAAGLVIGKEGSDEQIRIASGSILIGASASDYVALASKVLSELQNVAAAISTHTHPVSGTLAAPTAGTGTLVTSPYTPGSVAATLTKAK